MKRPTSLFVAADVHMLHGESNLNAVLSLILRDEGAVRPSAVLLGGDHAGLVGRVPSREQLGAAGFFPAKGAGGHDCADWQPVYRLDELRGGISGLLGPSVPVFFTYGSHDKNAADPITASFQGPTSLEHCHLYGVSFCQMHCADDAQLAERGYDGPDAALGGAERGVRAFLEWADALTDRKPLFVMSHIPLHAHRTDNLGALQWTRAFNRTAQTRDVFVFFGHNHTAEHLTPFEKECYFVPAGSTLPVQGREKEDQPQLTLRFTYLNAGYIANGFGTLLTLSDEDGTGRYDTLTIRRYSLHGDNACFGSTPHENPQRIRLRHL